MDSLAILRLRNLNKTATRLAPASSEAKEIQPSSRKLEGSLEGLPINNKEVECSAKAHRNIAIVSLARRIRNSSKVDFSVPQRYPRTIAFLVVLAPKPNPPSCKSISQLLLAVDDQNSYKYSGAPAGQSQTQPQTATQNLQPPAPSIFTASIGQLSQQQQTVPGVRVSVNELRPTTRFNDLHEDLQKMIENIDNFITEQMRFQTQCEQALEGQGEGVQRGVALAAETIPTDVKQCQSTLEAVQQSLENDAQTIAQVKALTKADAAHASLSFKALSILRMPPQFQNSTMWSVPNISQMAGPILVDDDLAPGIANNLVSYFSMQADDMSKALEAYKGRIEEVETYLTGLEASMTNQVQQLMFVRDHDGAPKSAEDQVKELAAVLNEMDTGIMGVAGKVLLAREQVQEVRTSVASKSSDRRHGRY